MVLFVLGARPAARPATMEGVDHDDRHCAPRSRSQPIGKSLHARLPAVSPPASPRTQTRLGVFARPPPRRRDRPVPFRETNVNRLELLGWNSFFEAHVDRVHDAELIP